MTHISLYRQSLFQLFRTLGSCVSNYKDRTLPNTHSGKVHKSQPRDCDLSFTGEAGRKCVVRSRESAGYVQKFIYCTEVPRLEKR